MSAAPLPGMTHRFTSTIVLWTVAGLGLATGGRLQADTLEDTRRQLESLKQHNAALEALVQQQASLIENLGRRVTDLEQANTKRAETAAVAPASDANDLLPPKSPGGLNFGKVNLSGEGGVAFFNTGRDGDWPNSAFRVDEAKLFVEAPIWSDVYFFSEINLATRENDDLNVELGEIYLDFENISQLWGRERQLNLRAGRLDVPFGEEYQRRDAIDNPLISHSLTDFWGVDEGVELYGALGKFSYVVAVQNGGVPGAQDYNADKAVVVRVGYDPNRWLHLSVSAMRTGDLNADDDHLSEIWFGNAWFRSIGSTNTTKFHANLIEGDVAVHWADGHFKAFGGAISYDDNDPNGNNQRDMYYYSVEAKQRLVRKLYAAARFSQIFADNGYPIAGLGNMGEYFFTWNPASWTDEIWRLSLGLGWQFSERLLVKAEYSFERGEEVSGETRDHEDFFGAEAAFKF